MLLQRRRVAGIVVLASAMVWFACHGVAIAQVRCPEEVREALRSDGATAPDAPADDGAPPGLEVFDDREPEDVACARIGGTAVLVAALILHRSADAGGAPDPDGPQSDDVWVRVTSAGGVLDVRLDAVLRRSGESLGWVDSVRIEVTRQPGARGLARVRVLTRMGEDYAETSETRLLVALPGAPRLIYGGPASSESSTVGYCVSGRVVRWTVRGGVLRVRTRVYAELVAANRPDDPELEASLRAQCLPPARLRADIALE